MSRLPDDWLTVVMNARTETQVPDLVESEHTNERVSGATFYQQLRDCALNKLNNYPYNNAKQVRILNATVKYCNDKIQESLRDRAYSASAAKNRDKPSGTHWKWMERATWIIAIIMFLYWIYTLMTPEHK